MAISAKRKPAKRKPSAAKKRKAKVGAGSKITVTSAGKKSTFSKASCHTSKTAAKAQAEKIRSTGVRAVVRPGEGKTVCVFKGPRMTAAGRKIYANTHKRKRAA